MGAVALFRQTLLDAAWQERGAGRLRPSPGAAAAAALPGARGARAGRGGKGDSGVRDRARARHAARGGAGPRARASRPGWSATARSTSGSTRFGQTGLPHLLPLAFPKPPKAAGKPAAGAAPDPTLELDELRHWDQAPENPRRLLATGLPVAFTSHRLEEPKKLYESLHRALGRGLTADQALAALTVAPARLLGIESRAGTIERGKMANLVVVEGDLFVEQPKIRAVWIDGARYEIKEREKPEIDPAGTWDLMVKTAEGEEISVTLELTGKPEALRGSVAAMGHDHRADGRRGVGQEASS